MTINVQTTNWLAEIGRMTGTYIHLSNLGGLTAKAANEAIEAMYGKGYAIVHDHGTVLWGTHIPNERKWYAQRLAEGKSVSDWAKRVYKL